MYFSHCKSLDELRAEYKRLALKHHPDMGGDTATMQDINAEYETAFNRLKDVYNADRRREGKPETTETPDKFRAIIDQLIRMDGLTVELCGSWLWIGGDTYRHKDALKAAGCKWSRNKQMWYWHHAEDGARWSRGRYTIDQIRNAYGSQVFTTQPAEKLTA